MRKVIELLLLSRLARGSLGRSVLGLTVVLTALLAVWAFVGQPALQIGLDVVIGAGVAGLVALPLIGLALGFVYVAAWLSSVGIGNSPRAVAPRRS